MEITSHEGGLEEGVMFQLCIYWVYDASPSWSLGWDLIFFSLEEENPLTYVLYSLEEENPLT